MKPLMLKTGGKFSYQFTVMISAKGKLTEFDFMQFYLLPSDLHGNKYCMWLSLCDNELFIVVWKMSFKYLNYVCPQAVNELLKWAACQRRQESERQAFSGPPLWQQEKTDYFLQRCHTATRFSRCMQNNKYKINKVLSLITNIFSVTSSYNTVICQVPFISASDYPAKKPSSHSCSRLHRDSLFSITQYITTLFLPWNFNLAFVFGLYVCYVTICINLYNWCTRRSN